MKKRILIAFVCGAAALTGAAPSSPSQTADYHYVLPLNLALEAATLQSSRLLHESEYIDEERSRGKSASTM